MGFKPFVDRFYLDDILKNIFGGGFGGNGFGRNDFGRDGSDLHAEISVSFDEAVFGCDKVISLSGMDGAEAAVQTLYGNVICKINPGTQSGTKIRLKGKGVVSMKNPEVRGDQYVTVQIEVPKHLSENAKRKSKEFEREMTGSHFRTA